MLGLALTRQGRFDEAEMHFLKAVGEEPGFSDAWYNLGMLRRAQGRLEEALSDFETAFNSSSLESFRGAIIKEIRVIQALLENETAMAPSEINREIFHEPGELISDVSHQ